MEAIQWTPALRFLVALALGFLVGLERESSALTRNRPAAAGVRTNTLVALYGFGCAWLYQSQVPLALPAGMLSVAALSVAGYFGKLRQGRIGWTSEASILLTFIVGALALLTEVWIAMALGIVNALLLSEKATLEKYVAHLDQHEFLAVLKFLVITLIVLPVLPNAEFTQFKLNPAGVWRIVIVVSSIGFAGYLLSKKFGAQAGLKLSGLLGGLVSSTAVSVASGRIAQRSPEQSGDALQATLLASSVMYLRILAIVWFINPTFVAALWWKLTALALVGLALALTVRGPRSAVGENLVSRVENPFELRPALLFGGLFVLLRVVTSYVQLHFGDSGLLALSAAIGVADIDPFIFSLVHGPGSAHPAVVAAIIMAMMSNTVVKAVYFGAQARLVRRQTGARFGLFALLHLPFIMWGL